MRIITGEARGTKLESPPDKNTRPTLERVKEGIFSALQFDIPGSRVLDLFGGSGQLGLEAVSRGASNAAIIDSSADALALIKRNAQKCRLMEKCNILQYDWKDYLKAAANSKIQFDIVFLDPPFGMGLLPKVLAGLTEGGLLSPEAQVICECSDKEIPIDAPQTLCLKKQYKYGKNCVSIYTHTDI